ALQGPGRDEPGAALAHDDEPGDAHARARDHGGHGRGRPHLHHPHGRAGGAAAAVHRGERARREEPGHLMQVPSPARRAWLLVPACALAAFTAGPARALPSMLPPELVVGAGWTMGVNGEPGTGGAAGTLAAQWPFAEHWSFGGAFFAQDQGTQ